MGEASKGTILKGKVEKNTALEHICEYVSVNFMSKKIWLCINLTTYSTGKVFFRNIELFTVSSLLTYMSNCYKATLPLSFSFQSRTQSEINSTKKHTLPWMIPSFVFKLFLKRCNTKRYSQVIQLMHYSKINTSEHFHEV